LIPALRFPQRANPLPDPNTYIFCCHLFRMDVSF
jgi:hypothetical protein